jgi:hypothetical protein
MSLALTLARPSLGNPTRQSPQLRPLGMPSPLPGRGQRRASVASGCSLKRRRSSLLKEVLYSEGALLGSHNSSNRPYQLRYLGSPHNSSSNSNSPPRRCLDSLLNSNHRAHWVHLCLEIRQLPLGSRLVDYLAARNRNSLRTRSVLRNHNSRQCSEVRSHSSRVAECLGVQLSKQLPLAGWG